MSRLLHAAARGARIEGSYKEFDIWNSVSAVRFDNFYDYRIHPDDAHLQYGPISTALREAAAAGNAWDLTGVFGLMARCYVNWHHIWQCIPDSDRSLFLLLMAEFLADEGM